MEPLYNGHHWDTRFCTLSRGVLAHGVIQVYHAPLIIVASYAGASEATDHEIRYNDKIAIDT